MADAHRPRDPITEEWFQHGTPLGHVGRSRRRCPACGDETPQDEYLAILGFQAGFVIPFLKRASTKGKVGKRSRWWACAECGSLLPGDSNAERFAQSHGLRYFNKRMPEPGGDVLTFL